MAGRVYQDGHPVRKYIGNSVKIKWTKNSHSDSSYKMTSADKSIMVIALEKVANSWIIKSFDTQNETVRTGMMFLDESGVQFDWKPYNGELPPGAVASYHAGKYGNMYVARSGETVGMAVSPKWKVYKFCTHNDDSHVSTFDVLCVV